MMFPDGRGGLREGVPWVDENGTTFVSSTTAKEIAVKLAAMEDKGSRRYQCLRDLWFATVANEAKASGAAYAVAGRGRQESLAGAKPKKAITVREMTNEEHEQSEQIETSRKYWEGIRARKPRKVVVKL